MDLTKQPSWIFILLVAIATAVTVPLETEDDGDISTSLDGEEEDLRHSIRVSKKQAWTTQSRRRPGYRTREPVTFDTTPRPGTNTRGGRDFKTRVTAGIQDLNIPESKTELKDLVQGLKDQLIESQSQQIATRSILNVVQEKQEALEEDLSFLKNEISTLHRQQTKDRESIASLKAVVSDNTWGINSLVTSQEHLKKDVNSLKLEQDTRNTSYSQLEDVIVMGFKKDADFHDSLQVLQREIGTLREDFTRDHEALNTVWEMVLGGGGEETDDDDDDDSNGNHDNHVINNQTKKKGHGRRHHDNKHHNQINPADNDNKISAALVPDALVPDLSEYSELSSSLDDKHATVRRGLEELRRREDTLRDDMDVFSQKFSTYDMELSRVYAMFYNLSFQMSNVENKLLQQQQRGYENNLSSLQQSLLNFTSQLYNAEKLHGGGTSPPSVNYTGAGRDVMRDIQARVEGVEKATSEAKANQDVLNSLVGMQISKLNNSVGRFYKSFKDHHIESVDVFDFIEEKFVEFERRIQSNDARLVQVEVRVLNATLGRCEATNHGLKQEKTLSDVDRRTNVLRKKVDNHNNMLNRLDHGMTRVFEDFGKQVAVMESIKTEISTIADIVPRVVTLQHEVSNIIMHLPKDCSDVVAQDPRAVSGPHLIRPLGGDTSADAYCDIGSAEGDTWTVIQRRRNGEVSFAREWSDYKFGFGSADNDFWLGNDNIHFLTTQDEYMIRIEMVDLQDRFWWAEYSEFRVDEEGDNYRLHISGYSGNATDALRYSNYMPFSTIDKDNDVSSTHCARFYTSGWWYKHCHYGNLNGRYTVGVVWFNHDSDEWVQLKNTVMKVRRKLDSEKDDKDQNSTKNAKNLENETSAVKFNDYYLSNS